MISMLYWCALRVSEMAAIKIKDINIKTGNLTLWQSKKSDTSELVHIPEQLIKSISQWTRENKLKPKDYLIRSQKGGSLSRIQISARSKTIAMGHAANFSMISHKKRKNYFFVFYSERLNMFWIMSSAEFLKHSKQNKTGKYIGKRAISFNSKKKDKKTGKYTESLYPHLNKYIATDFSRFK